MYGSKHFQRTFLIRFLGYFGMIAGFVVIVLGVEPVIGEEARFRADQLFGVKHVVPNIVTSNSLGGAPTTDQASSDSNFASIVSGGNANITPVDTNFGIVIEKINANAKVVANVDPANQSEYTQALAVGVAHAKGTTFPGQKGNIYLFSHSTDAPWNIVRYNAIFYLLGQLEKGDRIVMFYQGRRYDYFVFDKTVVPGNDVQYLTATYPNESVLTLQTCDPPGTILNRMIIRAKLVSS